MWAMACRARGDHGRRSRRPRILAGVGEFKFVRALQIQMGHPNATRDPFFPTDATPAFSSLSPSNARPAFFLALGVLPARPRLHPSSSLPPVPPSCNLAVEAASYRTTNRRSSSHRPNLLYIIRKKSPTPNLNLNCGAPPSPSILIHRST
jgi:hypothetical protein